MELASKTFFVKVCHSDLVLWEGSRAGVHSNTLRDKGYLKVSFFLKAAKSESRQYLSAEVLLNLKFRTTEGR